MFSMLNRQKDLGISRMSKKEALELLASPSCMTVGELALKARNHLHSDKAYYTINAAITYSNTCEALCPICSFARKEGHQEAYIITPQEAYNKAKIFSESGALELHMIGGMYSKLPLEYYVELIKSMRRADAKINIVAFTVSECVLMSRVSGKPLEYVYKLLLEAGLNAIPGGGAEIFEESIRQKISPNKLSAQEWLDAMRQAHKCGIKTNATMLYGHIESHEDVVNHLLMLRNLQDETGGFKAFVPLPFRKGASAVGSKSSGVYDLKICAISRILLDNFEHIRVPITHYSDRMDEILLHFGADDIGGTHWSEEVAVAAGAVPQDRSEKYLLNTITRAGFRPVKTNSNYAI